MKILFVTEDLPAAQLGGAGKHAVLLANALIEAGHHVEMLGRLRPPGVETTNGFRGRLHTLIDLHGTGWKEEALGVFLPMRREHMARRVWQAMRQVGTDWDVIHYHGHLPALGAIVPADLNFVHTLHDQGAECMTKIRFRDGAPCSSEDPADCAVCATARPGRLQTWISGWTVSFHRRRSVEAFTRHKAIFVSAFIERRFNTVTGCRDALNGRVIHNFVDAAALESALPPAATAVPGERPMVFMAGRVDVAKGFGALLAALPDEAFDRLDIVLAGDGPDLAVLQARFAGRGVRFLGWQPLEHVALLTAQADACVVPSIWDEPCGTTVLEALSLGRLVFALRRGGTPELECYGGASGQLRLFDSLPALADALPGLGRAERPAQVETLADVQSRLPEILDLYALKQKERT